MRTPASGSCSPPVAASPAVCRCPFPRRRGRYRWRREACDRRRVAFWGEASLPRRHDPDADRGARRDGQRLSVGGEGDVTEPAGRSVYFPQLLALGDVEEIQRSTYRHGQELAVRREGDQGIV